MKALLLVLLAAASLSAQTPNQYALPSGTPRTIADYVSTITDAGLISWDIERNVLAPVPGRTFGPIIKTAALCEVLKYGGVVSEVFGLKSLFPQLRPNGQTGGWPSMHSALAASSVTLNLAWTIPLSGSVGTERYLANLHTVGQVLSGFGVGLANNGLDYLLAKPCRRYIYGQDR